MLPLTNPNLGASVDLQYLLDEGRKAERAGEASFRGFRVLARDEKSFNRLCDEAVAAPDD
jgi:hypothetical protein